MRAPRRGGLGRPGAPDTWGRPGKGGPTATLPVDLVREGAALGGRHGAPRVRPAASPLPRTVPAANAAAAAPPGSGQPGLGGAEGRGRGPSGVPGRSVLPLPAGGRGSPGRSRALGAELKAEALRVERGRQGDWGGVSDSLPADALSALWLAVSINTISIISSVHSKAL